MEGLEDKHHVDRIPCEHDGQVLHDSVLKCCQSSMAFDEPEVRGSVRANGPAGLARNEGTHTHALKFLCGTDGAEFGCAGKSVQALAIGG